MPYLVEALLDTKPIKARGWHDYMDKEISPELLDGIISETVDRARIILQSHDSQHVAEAVESIELMLDWYFGDDDMLRSAQDPSGESLPQRLFRRDELSEPLALRAAMSQIIPNFHASDRKRSLWENGKETKVADVFGIDCDLLYAPPKYMAVLALRDSFGAARLLLEVEAYRKLDLDVCADSDIDPDDLIDECDSEAKALINEAIQLTKIGTGKAARALEAVTLAEAMQDHAALLRRADEQRMQTEQEASKRVLSENATKAAFARHERTRKIKEFAVNLAGKGTFRSTLQAAKSILPDVKKYARELGWPLSEDRAEKTVYEWLLEAK
jgi:hypothetical protein